MAFERKKRKIKIDVPRSKVKEKELKNNDVPMIPRKKPPIPSLPRSR